MSGKNILIIEDEAAIREMVSFALSKAGFSLAEASDATEAEAMMAEKLPDLILLDWMLPGMSGIELARRLKRDEYSRAVPIIMLTARSEEDDRVGGLEAGADDYITKPFSPRELVARIKAVLRRARPEGEAETMEADGLVLDAASHRVSVEGQSLDLGPTEYRLLKHFMSHAERVFSRGQLLDAVWGRNSFVEERTVDVHILRLRKVLGQYGRDSLVQTVRGAGYRFSAQ
jgi:two-component system, OmpR family, phosphate regulon response regulator PhoB